MPSKRSIRMKRVKKPARSNKSARLKTSTRLTQGVGVWAIAAVAICVLAGAMVIGARQGSEPPHRTSRETPPLETAPAAVVARKAPAPRALPLQAPPANATPVNASTVAESAVDPPVPAPASVTVTGCLERADETFRLKDTTGIDAVKARSWKSGFLKKRAASIDVVDAANRLKLPDHVGQRVSLTGTLVDREMHARSLQRISASCASNRKVKI
jgi:hypothetical protein